MVRQLARTPVACRLRFTVSPTPWCGRNMRVSRRIFSITCLQSLTSSACGFTSPLPATIFARWRARYLSRFSEHWRGISRASAHFRTVHGRSNNPLYIYRHYIYTTISTQEINSNRIISKIICCIHYYQSLIQQPFLFNFTSPL